MLHKVEYFLPSVIDMLVSRMSMSEDSAAAASLAFRHICDEMAADGEVCGSGCQTCILRSMRCKFVTTALTILSLAEENSCLSQSVRIATRNISLLQHVNPQFDLIATELKQELEGSIKAIFFDDY